MALEHLEGVQDLLATTMTDSSSQPEMHQNALASVSVAGLIQDRESQPVTVTLTRRHVPLNLATEYPPPECRANRNATFYRKDGPPPRLASKLPPPGTDHLELRLGKRLGDGASAVVFEVDQVSGAQGSGYIPPLVVKVARRNRCLSLGREAWFYEEMECLQGVVILRCYGWFEVAVEPDWRILGWDEQKTRIDKDELPAEWLYSIPSHRKFMPPHPIASELAAERNRLFVLVLERGGPPIINLKAGLVVRPRPSTETIRAAYTELAILGVNLGLDVRPHNILTAAVSPPALPSLPSPLTSLSHNIRLIDFGMAVKMDTLVDLVIGDAESYYENFCASEE